MDVQTGLGANTEEKKGREGGVVRCEKVKEAKDKGGGGRKTQRAKEESV